MSGGIDMDTNMKGGFLGGLGRVFTGESLFLATYTSAARDSRSRWLPPSPAPIIALEIGSGREFISSQKARFSAQCPASTSRWEWMPPRRGGAFRRRRFPLQRLSGQGLAFLEIDGHVVEKTLAPGLNS